MQVKERVERKLEKSGRITPREVLEAYRETGLLPATGDFLDGERACAIGALAVHRYGAAHPCLDEFIVALDKNAGGRYFQGFWMGFDGEEPLVGNYLGFDKGYRDGQRVRRFVFSS